MLGNPMILHDERPMTNPHDITTLKAAVRAYICGNFHVGDPSSLTDDTSLLDTGIVDSTGWLEIFLWIKEEFGVEVRETEMGPDNFETVGRIAAYLHRRLSGA